MNPQNVPCVASLQQNGAQDVRPNGTARGKMIETLLLAKRVRQTDVSRKLRVPFRCADYGVLAGLLLTIIDEWLFFAMLWSVKKTRAFLNQSELKT